MATSGRLSSEGHRNQEATERSTQYLMAESGANMAGVARTSIRQGLTGLEWAVSVPGTIGGAVVNNAGAHGGEVKDNLAVVQVVDAQGRHLLYSAEALDYRYRHSSLKSKDRPLRAVSLPLFCKLSLAWQKPLLMR